MYVLTDSPDKLMDFLKKRTYAGLPDSLWDGQLWFYDKVLYLLESILIERAFGDVKMFECCNNDETIGIALVEGAGDKAHVKIDALCTEGVAEFIANLSKEYHELSITVKNPILVELLKKIDGISYVHGNVRFYTENCPAQGSFPIYEIKPGDGHLFVSKRMPEGWPELDDILRQGIRYLSINEGGISVSSCGLCRLTALRTEIIAVGTRAEYRRKGYAKAVCAAAVKEALKKTKVATWTTSANNEASCSTARSLGFKLFSEIHQFTYGSKV